MLRLCVRATALLLLVMAVSVAVVRARPARFDPSVHALLRPSGGCAPPCFADVVPGETSLYEAALLLDAHPWVAEVRHYGAPLTDQDVLHWDWSGQQPAFINIFSPGRVHTEDGMVTSITIRTDIPLSDVILTMNAHALPVWDDDGDPKPPSYRWDGLLARPELNTPDPYNRYLLWDAPTVVIFGE